MKRSVFWVLTLVVFVIIGSCSKKDGDPYTPVQTKTHFWVNAGVEGGYALLLYTQDGGKTWTRQGHDVLFPDSGFVDGYQFDVNTMIMLGAPEPDGQSYCYLTIDRGSSWEKLPWNMLKNGVGMNDGSDLSDWPASTIYYACGVGNEDIWVVGDSGMIAHSQDLGESWGLLQPPDSLKDYLFYYVDAIDPDQIWMTAVTNLSRSDSLRFLMVQTNSNGGTWNIYNPLEELNIPVTPQTMINDFFLAGNSIWVAGTSNGSDGFILRSGDSGTTWENRGSGLPVTTFTPVNQVLPITEMEAYVLMNNQPVYGTMDGGNTWQPYTFPDFDKTELTDLLVVENEIFISGILTANKNYCTFFYSPDGGTTWEDRSFLLEEKNLKEFPFGPYRGRGGNIPELIGCTRCTPPFP